MSQIFNWRILVLLVFGRGWFSVHSLIVYITHHVALLPHLHCYYICSPRHALSNSIVRLHFVVELIMDPSHMVLVVVEVVLLSCNGFEKGLQ
jgi:hypothetical protein